MFPSELQQFAQWVCWKHAVTPEGKPTKLPISPRTGQLASVTNPSHWCDYETAVRAATVQGWGIGFVLTESDPYCFIDLDNPEGDNDILNRQHAIAAAMNSYSELSPSGCGLHIIIKAKVPHGSRRNKVEIYSSARYMTMTGQTIHNQPIAERQELATTLFMELNDNGSRNNIALIEDQAQKYTDEAIYNIAANAENGEKFVELWRGEWSTQGYKSQSEADFALINILGFYSRNVEQIHRMFLLSQLGQREKARKRPGYVNGMIRRSFDNMPPPVPLDTLIQKVADDLAALQSKTAASIATNPFAGPLFSGIPDADYEWTMPPGLLGEIAHFIHSAAPRPIKEVALAASIGLMAGICGRSYNVSGTGLNQYILVLAKTGVGKESAANGILRLMHAVRQQCPAAMDFIGPAEAASGQGLTRYLSKNQCFVSIVGEFGLALQQMCAANANPAQASLRRRLLELYNKSGATDVYLPTVYSDKEKDTKAIKSPAFSILGESTPETFYEALDESMIKQGLFPRFTCIEYEGLRPPLNKNHQLVQPSQKLVNDVGTLAAQCLVLAQHNKQVIVELDAEAEKLAASFDLKCDGKINTSELEAARQLWNRAHIKCLKLAALIAIGLNPYKPVISAECILWAIGLVERDVTKVLKRFETGTAGKETGELVQLDYINNLIKDYIKRPYIGLEKYKVIPKMHEEKVIALSYLQRRCLGQGAFSHDKIGATNALKRAIDSMIAEGSLRELKPMQVWEHYEKTMKAYVVSDVRRFLDA